MDDPGAAASKPVLCEKPLTGWLAETEHVLAVARETGTPLWEAFVFPFHDQMERVHGLLAAGAIGELREIQSDFHFMMGNPEGNVRMSADLAGGALLDAAATPSASPATCSPPSAPAPGRPPSGTPGALTWPPGGASLPGSRRLLLSCGFGLAQDTFSRLLGTTGQIHITNPFHTTDQDRFEVHVEGRPRPSTRRPGPTGTPSPRQSGTSRQWSGARSSPGCSRWTPHSAPPTRCPTSRAAPGANWCSAPR